MKAKKSKNEEAKTSDRDPRRSGARYCSSWCGAGCTWREYRAAQEAAKSITERLGPGWTPTVEEKFGWHASAVLKTDRGRISVTGCGWDGFNALVSQDPNSSGGRWMASGDTPREAVQGAMKLLGDELSALMSCFHSLASADPGKAS